MMSAAAAAAAATAKTIPKNIVIIGGGIQGTSVAYQILTHPSFPRTKTSSSTPHTITILESKGMASAASGKGGGFMARSWGDGTPTQTLHHLSFDMYESLSKELGCTTYRKLPVLSVSPGRSKIDMGRLRRGSGAAGSIVPSWLDGMVGRLSPMGMGDDTAQITPGDFVDRMLEKAGEGIRVVLGTCTGVDVEDEEEGGKKRVSGVRYKALVGDDDEEEKEGEEAVLPADVVVVSAGPWSCAAEDWFDNAVELPMEGIKSTSIVWKKPSGVENVDATALFCGEDSRFNTHLEVYPRPDGTIYICGIGGSDYIPKDELKNGAYRAVCNANDSRVDAASDAFRTMSETYTKIGELEKTQACMRPCPPDAMPYMGPVRGFEGAFINAGHNCWGIAWAPACGKAMAELVLEGESKSINLKAFDPSRFTPVANRGGRGRKRRGVDVGEQW